MISLLIDSTGATGATLDGIYVSVEEDRPVINHLDDIASACGIKDNREGLSDNTKLELPKVILQIDNDADGSADADSVDLSLSFRKNGIHDGMTVFVVDNPA